MLLSTPIKSLLIAALLGAAFTSSAFAQDQVFTARLATPVAARTHVVADNSVWTCEGDTCQAVARHAATVHDCRLLVRETGAVTAYGTQASPLSDTQIASCNGATTTQTAQNPQTRN